MEMVNSICKKALIMNNGYIGEAIETKETNLSRVEVTTKSIETITGYSNTKTYKKKEESINRKVDWFPKVSWNVTWSSNINLFNDTIINNTYINNIVDVVKRFSSGVTTTDKSPKAGAVVQLGERFPCTEEVAGSTPVSSTMRFYSCR